MAEQTRGSVGSINRREAIRRAAVLAGVAFSPAWLTLVDRRGGIAEAEEQGTGQVARAQARYLTPVQFATVAAVADRILPRTDTPGASDVGVPAFIDVLFGEYMTDAERKTLTSGLDAIERAATAGGSSFGSTPAARQDDLLRTIARLEDEEKIAQGPFRLIRSATILGYYTSEQVGRNVLHYDPVPGRYDSCVPMGDVGNRNWTT